MTAAVPLIAEALNLAITEHWEDVRSLRIDHDAGAYWRSEGRPDNAPYHDDAYSANIEALAVAVHARLQEQGALT